MWEGLGGKWGIAVKYGQSAIAPLENEMPDRRANIPLGSPKGKRQKCPRHATEPGFGAGGFPSKTASKLCKRQSSLCLIPSAQAFPLTTNREQRGSVSARRRQHNMSRTPPPQPAQNPGGR